MASFTTQRSQVHTDHADLRAQGGEEDPDARFRPAQGVSAVRCAEVAAFALDETAHAPIDAVRPSLVDDARETRIVVRTGQHGQQQGEDEVDGEDNVFHTGRAF